MVAFGIEGNGVTVKVTESGELVIAPLHYSETVFNEMNATATAFNYYGPKPKEQFVITAIIAFADKDISDASDTNIVIYEADSTSSTTADKVLLQFGMGKLTVLPLVPLNLLVNPSVFVNAKTDDADIHMTIMGFYIEEL